MGNNTWVLILRLLIPSPLPHCDHTPTIPLPYTMFSSIDRTSTRPGHTTRLRTTTRPGHTTRLRITTRPGHTTRLRTTTRLNTMMLFKPLFAVLFMIHSTNAVVMIKLRKKHIAKVVDDQLKLKMDLVNCPYLSTKGIRIPEWTLRKGSKLVGGKIIRRNFSDQGKKN